MVNKFFFLAILVSLFSLLFMAGCGIGPSNWGRDDDPNLNPSEYVWYVSPWGKDSASGFEPSTPLASVPAALARIKSLYRSGKWKAGESAVIVISGTLYGSGSFGPNESMIDISGTGSYPPMVLKGDPITGGVLNANRGKDREGRVLFIGNNKVTLGDNLILTGGYKLWGGAVCVGTTGSASGGEFIMAGGEIYGNVGQYGGAVMIYKGSMTMSGGVIKKNTNEYNLHDGNGGGIYLSDYTSLTISGGTITENGGAKTDTGGGVFVNGQAQLFMTGGEILNNISKTYGGGVHLSAYGAFTMSGGTIKDNKTGVSGGGVYTSPYSAVFIHSGGTVTGNTP
jgi:hypothetical protein